jgi:hypothetical protein
MTSVILWFGLHKGGGSLAGQEHPNGPPAAVIGIRRGPGAPTRRSRIYSVKNLRLGDVLLMTEGHPFSLLAELIEWATVSPYVHAALIGDGALIEAVWPTVATASLSKYTDTGHIFRVQCSDAERNAAVASAYARIGQPYGLAELLEDGGRDILHIPFHYRWSAPRLTCSALVAAAYRQAGVILTRAPLPSPADLSYSPALVPTD